MPLYSLKDQTLVTRWKRFRSWSSTIFVDDAVPQRVTYRACGHKKRHEQLFGLGNSWAPAQQPGSGTFGLSSLPRHEKTSLCQAIQITCWCQAWGANMAARSGSHLLSTGVWEMDFPPRQVSQQRRWLCGKISEVKCNKWIKRHLTVWGYLVAMKWGTLLSDFTSCIDNCHGGSDFFLKR